MTYKRTTRSLDYETHCPHSPPRIRPCSPHHWGILFLSIIYPMALTGGFTEYWRELFWKLFPPKVYIPLLANGLLCLYLRLLKEMN